MDAREALTRLVRALDAYFAAKGGPASAANDRAWIAAFNELMAALAEAKRH